MGTFTADLTAFAKKARGNVDLVVSRTVGEIATRIDERSPVGDPEYWASATLELHANGKHKALGPKGYVGGRFRGNWQLGIDSIPSGETGRIDPTGAETLGAIYAEIPTQAAGKVFWIANNVPYAQRIEEGWSRQAPTGLVGITATEFPQIVDTAVASVQ